MTLTEFRATGRDVAELADILDCAAQEAMGPGRIYMDGGLYIEGTAGHYTLTIGNQSMAGDLSTLEERLYTFAVSEGYIDAEEAYELFASELLSPGSACPAYQIRLQQLRIANRIDTEVQS